MSSRDSDPRAVRIGSLETQLLSEGMYSSSEDSSIHVWLALSKVKPPATYTLPPAEESQKQRREAGAET